ncbi:DUF1858 domain-containing protein [bacterium]|nr:DUF1858 domain-containing protein [bacterium]
MPTPITADMKVNEVLDRYPQTLEVFVGHGFKPLANPLMRRTFAHLVSIKGAARMHHWEAARLEAFLVALNERALAQVPLSPAAPEEAVLYDLKDVTGLRAQGIEVSPDVVRVDNRGLEPPEPMLRILAVAQQLAQGQRLEARNERRPMLLYPKLEELGLAHETVELAEGGVILTVRRL